MTEYLIRLFVKNPADVKNPKVREAYGVLSGGVGICVNLLLFAMKLAIGMLTASIAITADAFNNLSDGASSVISILGFRLSTKAPDKNHPFGYGRTEYLAGLAVAVIILMVGVEFAKSSVDKILNPTPVRFSLVLMGILFTSVLAKIWLGMFNRTLGHRIDSPVMKATMQDSINDSITTASVILAMLISYFLKWNIDGYLGLAVAAFILWSGFGIIKDTISPLIGQGADPDLAYTVEKTIMQFPDILGVHDLIIHNYGVGKQLASVHVEFCDTISFVQIHEIVDAAEKQVWSDTGVYLVIHMDPVCTSDERVQGFRQLTQETVASVSDRLSMHDFRVVDGDKQINLIFDVVLPYDFPERDHLVEKLGDKMRKHDKRFNLVVTLDYEM